MKYLKIMNKTRLLFIFILFCSPLFVFGQKRTVDKFGMEKIEYGPNVTYIHNGNPFDNNEEILLIDLSEFKSIESNCYQGDGFFIRISKSDLSSVKIEFLKAFSRPTAYMESSRYSQKKNYLSTNFEADEVRLNVFEGTHKRFFREELIEQSYSDSFEFIFDNDLNTYFKLDISSVNTINSLNNDFLQKLKKHNEVLVRFNDKGVLKFSRKHYSTGSYEFHRQRQLDDNCDYVVSLKGVSQGFNQFNNTKQPSIKNKSDYKVVNGLANTNPFNLDKYIDKFLLDAKNNHNIDLSFVNQKERLILFKELEEETIAVALRKGNDEEVFVVVDPENWYDANQAKRWYIIYHELGHDILNLEHGEGGRMMDERASGEYTWERLEKDKAIMFEYYKNNK